MSPRGGARPGAGRPKEPDARVTLAVRVKPATRAALAARARAAQRSQGELIDDLVLDQLTKPKPK